MAFIVSAEVAKAPVKLGLNSHQTLSNVTLLMYVAPSQAIRTAFQFTLNFLLHKLITIMTIAKGCKTERHWVMPLVHR